MGHHHENTKAVVDRLSRAIGHLNAIKGMVEEGRDCSEVLMQIAASRSALNGLGKQIIVEHISHCIAHAVEDGDTAAIESFRNDNVDTPYGLSTYVRLSEKLGGEIICADNSHTQKIVGTPYSEISYPEGVTSYFVFVTR